MTHAKFQIKCVLVVSFWNFRRMSFFFSKMAFYLSVRRYIYTSQEATQASCFGSFGSETTGIVDAEQAVKFGMYHFKFWRHACRISAEVCGMLNQSQSARPHGKMHCLKTLLGSCLCHGFAGGASKAHVLCCLCRSS